MDMPDNAQKQINDPAGVPPSGSKVSTRSNRAVLLGGLLLILLALPVGVFFISQERALTEQRSKAATAPASIGGINGCLSGSPTCIVNSGVACNPSRVYIHYCDNVVGNEGCVSPNPQYVGTVNGGTTVNINDYLGGRSCGSVQLDLESNSTSSTSTGGCGAILARYSQPCTVGIAPSATPVPESTAAPPPPAGQITTTNAGSSQCGQACTTATDCAKPANGGVAICRNGICENAACPAGQTIPGANCDCGVHLNRCGQHCSASLGLCAPNQGSCAYVVGPSCADPINGTYCTGTSNGYTKKNCVSRDIYNSYLIGPGGKTTGFTDAELAASCQICGDGAVQGTEQCDNGALNGTAQSLCDVTCHLKPAGQCTRIKIYKNNTVIDASTVKIGDAIQIAVVGTNATKGRARVNGGDFTESSATNSAGEFLIPYTVPSGVNVLVIEAETLIGGEWK